MGIMLKLNNFSILAILALYLSLFVVSIDFGKKYFSYCMEKTRKIMGGESLNQFERRNGTIKSVNSTTFNSVDYGKSSQYIRKTTCKRCFQHHFKYLINNINICNINDPGQTIDLFIIVFTQHRNKEARDAIRKTWLTISKNNTANVRYAFFLGKISNQNQSNTVVQESILLNDILQEDFVDTYKNLTYKTIMGFKWVVKFCALAKFVMKTDDDSFVNIPNILHFIKSSSAELETRISGSCHNLGRPIRDIKSKWHASFKSYKERYYPGYCSGSGYITTFAVAKEIYHVSESIPFFHLEDIYVALCLWKIGGKIRNIAGFNSGRINLDPCLFKGYRLFTSHRLTPSMMKRVWTGVSSC